MKTFIYNQRVYFSDTDAQGIVYHAAYLNFAEHARTELGRELHASGLSGGNAFVVKSISISYEKPGYLDDMLTVETRVKDFGKVTIVFSQTVKRGDEVLADMEVKVACINLETKRPVRIGEELLSLLS